MNTTVEHQKIGQLAAQFFTARVDETDKRWATTVHIFKKLSNFESIVAGGFGNYAQVIIASHNIVPKEK